MDLSIVIPVFNEEQSIDRLFNEIKVAIVSQEKGRGTKDKVFRNFDSTFKVLQWHSYEVQDLESVNDVFLLASSESTKYQIFKYKDYAYGVQFHTEIKEDTISSWGKITELKEVIENNLGKNALHLFEKEGKKNIKNMKLNTEKLYENFKKIL